MLLTFSSCHLDYFCIKVERDKNIDHKWVERTPNSDLVRDYPPINQAQVYCVKICLFCVDHISQYLRCLGVVNCKY